MKKRNKKVLKIILICLVAAAVFGGGFYAYKYKSYYDIPALETSVLDGLELDGYDKLMIVAHPDDDTIWGGAHLLSDDYLVVCITNGYNDVRRAEFEKAMEFSGDKALILSYPDKTFKKRDDWTKVREGIIDDLTRIIAYKDWKLIVTHNTKGEYGHQHHIMTNEIVTRIYRENRPKDSELYYFGKYYRAKNIKNAEKDGAVPISDELLARKEEMLKAYESQADVVRSLSHMNPYEEWSKAE